MLLSFRKKKIRLGWFIESFNARYKFYYIVKMFKSWLKKVALINLMKTDNNSIFD